MSAAGAEEGSQWQARERAASGTIPSGIPSRAASARGLVFIPDPEAARSRACHWLPSLAPAALIPLFAVEFQGQAGMPVLLRLLRAVAKKEFKLPYLAVVSVEGGEGV